MNIVDVTILASIEINRAHFEALSNATGAPIGVMVAATLAVEMLGQAAAWTTLDWTKALEIEASAKDLVAAAIVRG